MEKKNFIFLSLMIPHGLKAQDRLLVQNIEEFDNAVKLVQAGTTIVLANEEEDKMIFTRIGNDPDFNLKNDPSLIIRRKDKGSTLFANALEIHGTYSTVTKAPIGSTSFLKSLAVLTLPKEN